jgi:hypothetical protein
MGTANGTKAFAFDGVRTTFEIAVSSDKNVPIAEPGDSGMILLSAETQVPVATIIGGPERGPYALHAH